MLKRHQMKFLGLAIMLLAPLLVSCGGPIVKQDVDGPGDIALNDINIVDAVPRDESRSRYGNPTSYVVFGKTYQVMENSDGYVERGIASWYGKKFHGRRTSSGEAYDMYKMTAAHKSLPLPTYVQVSNLKNGRTAVLKVNDRGPFHDNRVIDLSYAAAHKLGILAEGTGLVEVRAIDTNSSTISRPVQAAPLPLASNANPAMYIQVGAFASRQNAEQLRESLLRHQLGDINIKPFMAQQTRVYRVRIGPLLGVEAADQTAARLNDMGLSRHHVVID